MLHKDYTKSDTPERRHIVGETKKLTGLCFSVSIHPILFFYCTCSNPVGLYVLITALQFIDLPCLGQEGQLSRILLDSGLMFRARCLELESTKYKVSYVLLTNAFLNTMSHRL